MQAFPLLSETLGPSEIEVELASIPKSTSPQLLPRPHRNERQLLSPACARRDSLQHKLAEDVRPGVADSLDKTIGQRQRQPAAARRIVEIRECSGDEGAEHMRIVGAPMAVVAPGDYGGGDCIHCPRGNAAGALVEVAGVLMEEGGKDSAAQHSR